MDQKPSDAAVQRVITARADWDVRQLVQDANPEADRVETKTREAVQVATVAVGHAAIHAELRRLFPL